MKGLLKAALAAAVSVTFTFVAMCLLLGAVIVIEKEMLATAEVTQREISGGRFWEVRTPRGELVGNMTTRWRRDGGVDFEYHLNEELGMPPQPPRDPETKEDREGTLVVLLVLFGLPFILLTSVLYVIQNL